jgi:hypothetical protein
VYASGLRKVVMKKRLLMIWIFMGAACWQVAAPAMGPVCAIEIDDVTGEPCEMSDGPAALVELPGPGPRDCWICSKPWDQFDEKGGVRVAACAHVFHSACVSFSGNRVCQCGQKFFMGDEYLIANIDPVNEAIQHSKYDRAVALLRSGLVTINPNCTIALTLNFAEWQILDLLKLLSENGINLYDETLVTAAQFKKKNLVRELLKCKVSPNTPSVGEQRKPIHWAIWNCSYEMVADLLRAGADANALCRSARYGIITPCKLVQVATEQGRPQQERESQREMKMIEQLLVDHGGVYEEKVQASPPGAWVGRAWVCSGEESIERMGEHLD